MPRHALAKLAFLYGISLLILGTLILSAQSTAVQFVVILSLMLFHLPRLKGFWPIFILLSLPFYGLNISIVSATWIEPFTLLLAGVWLTQACITTPVAVPFPKMSKELFFRAIGDSRLRILLSLALLVIWINLRSFTQLKPWLHSCIDFGLEECAQSLTMAGYGDPLGSLRIAISWQAALCLCFMVALNKIHALPQTNKRLWQQGSWLVTGTYFVFVSQLIAVLVQRFSLATQSCNTAEWCQLFVLNLQGIFHDSKNIGTFGNPGWFGQMMILIFCLLVGFSLKACLQKRFLWGAVHGAAGIGCGLIAITSGQRATWLGLAACLVFAAVSLFKGTASFTRRTKIILLGSAAAGAIVFAIFGGQIIQSQFAERLNADSSGRSAIWKLTPAMIADRPLRGHGIGNFEKAMTKIQNEQGIKHSTYQTAHNSLINLAVEAGIPALLLGLVFVFSMIQFAIRGHSNQDKIVLFAALTGMLANSLFQDVSYNRAVFYCLAVVVGLSLKHGEFRLDGHSRHINSKLAKSKKDVTVNSLILWGIAFAAALITLNIWYAQKSPAIVSGCYSKEQNQQKQYFRWCSELVELSATPNQGILALEGDWGFARKLQVIAVRGREEIPIASIEKPSKKKTAYTLAIPLEELQAGNEEHLLPAFTKILVKADNAKKQKDGRKLAFTITSYESKESI